MRRKESLEAAVESALEQIEKKKYESALLAKGFGDEGGIKNCFQIWRRRIVSFIWNWMLQMSLEEQNGE